MIDIPEGFFTPSAQRPPDWPDEPELHRAVTPPMRATTVHEQTDTHLGIRDRGNFAWLLSLQICDTKNDWSPHAVSNLCEKTVE